LLMTTRMTIENDNCEWQQSAGGEKPCQHKNPPSTN